MSQAAQLKLVRFDKNRDEEANEVHALFAALTEKATVNCERMAGFAVVVWDDEGVMDVQHRQGRMSPLPSAMIPRLVKDYLTVMMVE